MLVMVNGSTRWVSLGSTAMRLPVAWTVTPSISWTRMVTVFEVTTIGVPLSV